MKKYKGLKNRVSHSKYLYQIGWGDCWRRKTFNGTHSMFMSEKKGARERGRKGGGKGGERKRRKRQGKERMCCGCSPPGKPANLISRCSGQLSETAGELMLPSDSMTS